MVKCWQGQPGCRCVPGLRAVIRESNYDITLPALWRHRTPAVTHNILRVLSLVASRFGTCVQLAIHQVKRHDFLLWSGIVEHASILPLLARNVGMPPIHVWLQCNV